MNLVVTGASGFLGEAFIRALLDPARCAWADRIASVKGLSRGVGTVCDPRVTYVAADLCDRDALESSIDQRTTAVVHLAAVVSGTAEANFDLGMRVNIDGTRTLLDVLRARGDRPRVVFASSLAVFGGDLPPRVGDTFAPSPRSSYGMQKLIGELLVEDYTRKGFIDGCSLRLPTIAIRPGAPNGSASGFVSSVIREPLSGRPAVLPVPATERLWVMSPRMAIANLIHAVTLPPSAWKGTRSLTLPGLTVSMAEVLGTLEVIAGSDARARVDCLPDDALCRIVQSWPCAFDTPRADAMGFQRDADFASIVRDYIATHPEACSALSRLH